jgi:hypothetical protein
MTYEEYEKTRWEFPYVFTVNKDNKSLYYFGEVHSYDPKDDQWARLKDFWNEFLEKTKGGQRMVFTEGGVRPVENTEEEAIVKWGGMGLVTFLAAQENIKVFSPEPDEAYERSELEKEFPRDAIQYYYFARMVLQWGRHQDPKPEFTEYLSKHLIQDQRESGWSDFDFSLENMIQIHKDLFSKDFDQNDKSFFRKVATPVHLETVINKVSRKSGEIRDEYIVSQIAEYMENSYSLFVQYKNSHAVVQRRYLEELLDKNP